MNQSKFDAAIKKAVKEEQVRIITAALEEHGTYTAAAEALGAHPTTIMRLARRWNLRQARTGPRRKPNPRHYAVSTNLSEPELDDLESVCKHTQMTKSDFIRMCIMAGMRRWRERQQARLKRELANER